MVRSCDSTQVSGGWAASISSMAPTTLTEVTSSRRASFQKVEAWNFGVRATGKPWASAVINEYACALMWNRGRQAHNRWWPPRPIQPGKDRPVSVYDACRTRTPLGRLVVPEVETIAAGLNGSTIAGPAAGGVEATSMA